jgi:hypothetical protein
MRRSGELGALPAPPCCGDQCPEAVGHDVPRISGRPRHNPWANSLEQNGPNHQVEKNFPRGWRAIVVSKFEATLDEQQRRQRAGDQEQVVEMVMEKGTMQPRFESPAIQSVEQAGQQKKPVPTIAEPIQSRARMTRPKAIAMASFARRIIIDQPLPPGSRRCKGNR